MDLNHDSFKTNLTYNTDGIGNWLRRARRTKVLLGCLQQPGLLSNQPHKSMRSKSFPLIKISVP
jgi:hypothetical protein